MKKAHACPKCAGRRIWIVAPWKIPSDTVEGNAVPVLPHQPKDGGGFFEIARQNPIGRVDLWVCDACGYSELWAEGAAELREDPARGIRLLDSSATKAGPFR